MDSLFFIINSSLESVNSNLMDHAAHTFENEKLYVCWKHSKNQPTSSAFFSFWDDSNLHKPEVSTQL